MGALTLVVWNPVLDSIYITRKQEVASLESVVNTGLVPSELYKQKAVAGTQTNWLNGLIMYRRKQEKKITKNNMC